MQLVVFDSLGSGIGQKFPGNISCYAINLINSIGNNNLLLSYSVCSITPNKVIRPLKCESFILTLPIKVFLVWIEWL